jgi:hypothetical protein
MQLYFFLRENVFFGVVPVSLQQSPEKIFFKANTQRSTPHQEYHLLRSDIWQKKLQKQFVFLRVWHDCCFHHLEEPIINLQRKRKKG